MTTKLHRLHICFACDEPTSEMVYCESCGEPYCPDCADIHLIEEGNNTDDRENICDICIRERRGI